MWCASNLPHGFLLGWSCRAWIQLLSLNHEEKELGNVPATGITCSCLPFGEKSLWRPDYGAWKAERTSKRASWSRGSFWWRRQLSFICKTSYGRHRTQWHKPFENREGREITGSLETYRNKRKKRKDKVKVFLCVAILESLMLYYMRSAPDGDVGRMLVAGVMWISHTAFKYESKDVVPVLLFLLEASHPHNIVNHPATHKKSSKQQCLTRPQSTASHLTKQLMRIQAVS